MWACRDRRRAPAVARSVIVLAGALLVLTVPGHPAAAHAVLVGSEPPDGATLARAPRAVELRFGEDVSPRFSTARLVDGDGRPVGGTAVVSQRGGSRRLLLELPALHAGAYGVLWQALAENDGHTTRGVVVFNVGAGAGSPALAVPAGLGQPAARPADVARRWVGLCLLAGLVGALAVALALGLAGPGQAGDAAVRPARRRLLAFAAACAALAAAAHLVDAAVEAARQAPATGGGFWTSLARLMSGTHWGQLWLVREVVLLALALALARSAAALGRPGGRHGRLRWAVAAALVLTLVSVEAAGSHAAALSSARTAALAADALHILTACVWLGMLPALVLLAWPGRGGRNGAAALLRASRGALTQLAAVSVGLVLVTGLYEAGREVDAVDGLVSTTYGRALLAKSALLLLAGGLGLVNAARLHGWRPAWPRSHAGRAAQGRRPARLSARLVAVEAGVGALLLVAVGLLLESAPARGPAAPATVPAAAAAESATVADLVASVSVTPNTPGVNGFTVLAASSRRPPPAAIVGVALRLAQAGASSSVALRQVAPGRWFGTGRLDRAGRLRLTVVVRRAGQRVTAPLAWQVEPAKPAAPPAPAAGRRLAPIVDGVALILLAGAAATGVTWLLRSRRRRRQAGGGTVEHTQPAERVLEGMR
jgi:copper transport protein